MACEKCGYVDKKEKELFGKKLCSVCIVFAPQTKEGFEEYVLEKIDWKLLDTFRKFNSSSPDSNLKKAMSEKAKQGKLVTRAPLGYDVRKGCLVPNEHASKIHSLFAVFLNKDYSLNSLSKNYGLSINGLKKILQNRTYLGEIKFAGTINKGKHSPIISPEIFYAVQRKLKDVLRG
jgi:site-specific DNA recombinase